MGYLELINTLRALPADKRTEVIDFIEFIASRCGVRADLGEWTDRSFSEFALQQALRDMEDDPITYSADDICEPFQ